MSKLTNFRGAEEALLINVLEGSGIEEDPYDVVKYVIVNGEAVGRVVSLGDE